MFNSDMTVQQWTDALSNAKNKMNNAIDGAYEAWEQWDDYTKGLNVSGIMQLPVFGERTFSDVQKINRGFEGLKDVYDVVNGNMSVSSPKNFMKPLAPFR